ncbi:MAG: CoA-binding protein [Pirellulaceae bacterium]|nr:CoA-binding protein [Pirellulaceae bacterium]
MSTSTVAILGASSDRSKFGNKSVRAHQQQGYKVFPVNPKGGEIEGLPAYQSLSQVPCESLDRVSVYLPPHICISVLDAVAEKGCRELWLNPGSESPEIIQRARDLQLNVVVGCSIVDVGMSPNELSN